MKNFYVVIVLIILGLCAYVVLPQWQMAMWDSELHETIRSLKGNPPEGVSEDRWGSIIRNTDYSIGNCFGYGYVKNNREYRAFIREFRKKFAEPVTLDTIAWYWDQVEVVSGNGKKYSEMMRPYPYVGEVEVTEVPLAHAEYVRLFKYADTSVPSSASNILYATTIVNDGVGAAWLYRFEAPVDACIAYAQKKEGRVGEVKPITAPVSAPPAGVIGACCIEGIDWFDVETVVEGFVAGAPLKGDWIVVDTKRSRVYRLSYF